MCASIFKKRRQAEGEQVEEDLDTSMEVPPAVRASSREWRLFARDLEAYEVAYRCEDTQPQPPCPPAIPGGHYVFIADGMQVPQGPR